MQSFLPSRSDATWVLTVLTVDVQELHPLDSRAPQSTVRNRLMRCCISAEIEWIEICLRRVKRGESARVAVRQLSSNAEHHGARLAPRILAAFAGQAWRSSPNIYTPAKPAPVLPQFQRRNTGRNPQTARRNRMTRLSSFDPQPNPSPFRFFYLLWTLRCFVIFLAAIVAAVGHF